MDSTLVTEEKSQIDLETETKEKLGLAITITLNNNNLSNTNDAPEASSLSPSPDASSKANGNINGSNPEVASPKSKAAVDAKIQALYQLWLGRLRASNAEIASTALENVSPTDSTTCLWAVLNACVLVDEMPLITDLLNAMKVMPASIYNSETLNNFLQGLCDAVPRLSGFFTSQALTVILRFLLSMVRTYLNALSLDTFMRIFETCILLRHEDKHNDISIHIIQTLVKYIPRETDCSCRYSIRPPETTRDRKQSNAVERSVRFRDDPEPLEDPEPPKPTLPPSRCSVCRWHKMDVSLDPAAFARTTLLRIIDHVALVKKIEPDVKRFQRHQCANNDFRIDVYQLVTMLTEADLEEEEQINKSNSKPMPHVSTRPKRMLYALVLMCCKFATESTPFNLKKVELVKRKIHAMRLLQHIFQNSGQFFLSSRGAILLLRRFVCPSLVSACVTDVPVVFRLVLSIFTHLHEHFSSALMVELGVLIDMMFLSLLESPFCTFQQKKDILDTLLHILRTPFHLISLFYNYDNSINGWKIFDRMVLILSKLSEGGVKTMGTSSTANAHASETGAFALRKQTIRLLVHIMHMQAQWLGVPGIKRAANIPTQPVLADDRARFSGSKSTLPIPSMSHQRNESIMDTENSHLRQPSAIVVDGTTETSSNPSSIESALLIHEKLMGNLIKNSTWNRRFDKQKADAQVTEHALRLARTDKVKSALKYLKIVNPTSAVVGEIARFLYENDGMDKSEVGDILGTACDDLLSSDEYENLRASYLDLLDFTGMSFDAGLRTFLCDSGFRLPGEAQKIDRLLEAFCRAYCRDNTGVFRNHSSAFVVAFALVMLNTDLHDPRLKSGSSSRKPMSLAAFISNLRGVDDGHDFPPAFLTTLYENIRQNAIEWKDPSMDPTKDAKGQSSGNSSKDSNSVSEKEQRDRATRKHFELLVRRACAYLKNHASDLRAIHQTTAARIVVYMFEKSWFRCIASITVASETCTDVDILHLCLDGLAYGSVISIVLGLSMERQAFTRVLAKLTFIEKQMGTFSYPSTITSSSDDQFDLSRRLIAGEHLKQEWYRPLNFNSEKHPVRACKQVLRICADTKTKISAEKRVNILKQFQETFGNEIHLVADNRSFLKDGKLTKVHSSTGKTVIYSFFLFTDLVIYATHTSKGKFKCRRVIHLSLCRLEDIKSTKFGGPAFRIRSPQKSVVVCAASDEKKKAWLDALSVQIEQQLAQRNRYIEHTCRMEAQFCQQFGADNLASGRVEASFIVRNRDDDDLNYNYNDEEDDDEEDDIEEEDEPEVAPTAAVTSTDSQKSNPREDSEPEFLRIHHEDSEASKSGNATDSPSKAISPAAASGPPATPPAAVPETEDTHAPLPSSSSRLSQSSAVPSRRGLPIRNTRRAHSRYPSMSVVAMEGMTSPPSFTPVQNRTFSPQQFQHALHEDSSSVTGQTLEMPQRKERDLEWRQSEVLRRYSTFIGANLSFALDDASSSALANALSANEEATRNHCKLCLRYFSLFRRRIRCRFCSDYVCSECSAHRVRLPSAEKIAKSRPTEIEKGKVCDSCAGVLNGVVNDTLPLLLIVED